MPEEKKQSEEKKPSEGIMQSEEKKQSEEKALSEGNVLSEEQTAAAEEAERAWQKRHRRRVRAVRSFLLRLFSLALVVYILVFHIVGIAIMPNGDMYPRLDAGDLLLFYRIDRNIKSQDIVVIDKAVQEDYSAVQAQPAEEPTFFRKALNWLGFKDPAAPPTRRFVGRVIACAGDTVNLSDEQGLIVNGNTLVEPNIFYPTKPYEGYMEYPVTLKPGEYFVLSDYRNGGADSRFYGPVKLEEIQGIVITVVRRNNL